MHVEWSITFGEALTVFSITVGAIGMYFGVRMDVKILQHDLESIDARVGILNGSFETLAGVLTKVAVQDSRLDRMEADLQDLRHGKGLVK